MSGLPPVCADESLGRCWLEAEGCGERCDRLCELKKCVECDSAKTKIGPDGPVCADHWPKVVG